MLAHEVVLDLCWYKKYELKDAPEQWVNPHLEAVWNMGTEEQRDIGRMAIGVLMEPDTFKRSAKFNQLEQELERRNIYTGLTFGKLTYRGLEVDNMMAAAIMEVFTQTGVLSRKQGGEA